MLAGGSSPLECLGKKSAQWLGVLHEKPNTRLMGAPPVLDRIISHKLQITAKQRVPPKRNRLDRILIGTLVVSRKPCNPFKTNEPKQPAGQQDAPIRDTQCHFLHERKRELDAIARKRLPGRSPQPRLAVKHSFTSEKPREQTQADFRFHFHSSTPHGEPLISI